MCNKLAKQGWTFNKTKVKGQYCNRNFSGTVVADAPGEKVYLMVRLDEPFTLYGHTKTDLMVCCEDPSVTYA